MAPSCNLTKPWHHFETCSQTSSGVFALQRRGTAWLMLTLTIPTVRHRRLMMMLMMLMMTMMGCRVAGRWNSISVQLVTLQTLPTTFTGRHSSRLLYAHYKHIPVLQRLFIEAATDWRTRTVSSCSNLKSALQDLCGITLSMGLIK